MTREKIIKIVNDCVQYNANQGTWSIDNRFADELLELIDEEEKNYKNAILSLWAYKEKQIKKETAKEILHSLYSYCDPQLIKDTAKEYGVEL